jgi:phosphate transport system permease protein
MQIKALSLKQIDLFDATIWLFGSLILCIFITIIGHIFWHGISVVSFEFLFSEPLNAGRSGGIWPIIVSTLLILAICMGVSLPLGFATALLLSEFTNDASIFSRCIRRSLDVLAGIPSIVFGLFGNAFFCKFLGLGFSILSGGLTLACMVLPILIRSVEESLRAVPNDYRRATAALGFSKTSSIMHVIAPAAIPGVVVGFALGLGRAIAETAALIFTSGYVDRMPESVHDSGRALSIHIYDLSMNIPGGDKSAYGSSLMLIALLLLINVVSAKIAHHWMQKRIKLI